MPRDRLRRLTESAIALALSIVLHQYAFYQLPNGGRITLGSMVPILYISLRWGAPWGILTGALAGVLNFAFEPVFVHPIQWLLDYPVAFGAVGLAGLFPRRPPVGVLAGGAARWFAHFLSGIVFFAKYAPKGQSPWLYSAVYNASYMLPEIVISIVLTLLVLRSLQRLEPATH